MIASIRIFLTGLLFFITTLSPIFLNTNSKSLANEIIYLKTEGGLGLSLETTQYRWDVAENGLALNVKNSENVVLYGQPVIPTFSALLAIPAQGEFKYRQSFHSEKVLVPPSDMALATEPTNEYQVSIIDPSDSNSYSCLDKLISNPIDVGEPVWIRNQRVVRIVFHPFRWDCQKRVWLYSQKLEISVDLDQSLTNKSEPDYRISSPEFEVALRGSLINYQDSLTWRGLPSKTSSPFNPDSFISKEGILSEKVRITITEAGVYQIGMEDLLLTGVDVTALDPNYLQLENQGRKVSFEFVGDDDDTLETGESIIFYAEQFDGSYLAGLHPEQDDHWATYRGGFAPKFTAEMVEKYNDNNIFWLSTSSDPSPRIVSVHQGFLNAIPTTNFSNKIKFEKDWYWWTYHFTDEETWFWEKNFSVSNTLVEKSYPFTIRDAILDSSLIANLELQITSNSASALNPDHVIEVFLNNQPLGQESWDGAVWHTSHFPLSQDNLINGENVLRVRYLPISGVTASSYGFDEFSIQFVQQLIGHDQYLQFSQPAGDWTFQINGFSADPLHIWDISYPLTPVELGDYSQEEGVVTFSNSQIDYTDYVVFGAGGIQSPLLEKVAFGGLYDPQNRSDYLIITVPDFLEPLQPLVDWRSQQGLQVKVVTIQSIYDQFNFGIPHPIAIKNFMRYAFENWQTVPEYVLLVGDGHWDLKNYRVDTPNYLPPNFVWVDPVQGEIDSLSDLVAVVGDDILPDALIGRMAVNSTSEVSALVEKTIAFEQSEGDWSNSLAFVADNYYLNDYCFDGDPSTICLTESAGNFPALMDDFINDQLRTPFQPTRFYLDDYNCRSGQSGNCAIITSDLVSHINQSPSQIYTYSGHGVISGWASEKIFNKEDLPFLTNSERFPVFFSLDCIDGFWYYPPGIASPDPISLAESITRQPNGGAVAMYSATGFSYSSAHDVLQRGFFEYFFSNHDPLLGAADLSAKLKVYASGNNDEMIFTYMIFGDPALRLHNDLRFIYLPLLSR